MSTARFRRTRLVALNVAIFCTLLVLLELTAQLAFALTHGHLLASHVPAPLHREVFELHPYLVGRLRANVVGEAEGKRVTTTAQRTRTTGSPDRPGALRIVILGGSTAFGTFADDQDSWPYLLQQELGDAYHVMNYGVPGFSTAEAIIQLALQVPAERPDLVLLYEGWNDIRLYHQLNVGADYYLHGLHQYGNLGLARPVPPPYFARLAEVSAVVWYVRDWATPANAEPPQRAWHERAPTREPDPVIDALYRRNLTTLRHLTHQLGAHALFVPQVLNVAAYRGDPKGAYWTPYIVGDAMPDLMARFNGIMQEVAGPATPATSFLASPLTAPWEPADFVDRGHFTRQGGQRMASLVATHIRELRQAGHLPPPTSP